MVHDARLSRSYSQPNELPSLPREVVGNAKATNPKIGVEVVLDWHYIINSPNSRLKAGKY